MSKRLVETITNGQYTAKVYKIYQWDEIQVIFYKGSRILPELTYFAGHRPYDIADSNRVIEECKNVANRELAIWNS